jgi:hypothetical protein
MYISTIFTAIDLFFLEASVEYFPVKIYSIDPVVIK